MLKNLISAWLLLLALLAYSPSCFAQDGYRHWTTSDGKRSGVRLKLVDSDDTQIRLQREDSGKIILFLRTGLSAADLRFLTELDGSSPQTAMANDWPQWRGANRDGKSNDTGLLTDWPAEGPSLQWGIEGVGEGYSTPAVVGDVVYLMGTRDNEEYLFAFSVSDGGKLWESRIGNKSNGGGFPGPKGTPTVDGQVMFAIGSDGTLVCIQSANGQRVWSKNLRTDFGGRQGNWDYAESPLLDGDNLICTPGGDTQTLVALQKTNGSTIWSSPVGRVLKSQDKNYTRAAYASTITASIAGTRQVIAFLQGGVIGVTADKGTPLWHYDSPANGTANCSTPVVHGDSVFAASGYGTGGGRADIARRGRQWNVDERFFTDKMQSHHGGFVLHDGFIYGTNDSVLLCLDWDTGQIQWQDRCVGKGSITFADNHLYVRGEGGDVALVEASPEEYREKGRFRQPDRSGKKAWAHPVVAGGRLFLHDGDRLFCYLLK